jgi:hypothetical protein
MKLHALLVAAVLGVSVASAKADSVPFQLRVDATRPTCAEQKADVQKTLLEAGETVAREIREVRVSCLQELTSVTSSGGQHRAYLMGIRIDAKSVQPVYQAHWGSGSQSLVDTEVSRGFFATVDECLAAERNERAVFERHTGLAVQFSACTTDGVGSRAVLSVTAFGTPKSRLRAIELAQLHLRDETLTAEELGWVRGYMGSKGADLRAVVATRVLFFSEKPIDITMRRMGHWYVASQCDAQIAEARSMFSSAPATVSCQAAGVDSTLTWINLRVIHGGLPLLREDTPIDAPRYASFEECRSFLPDVLEDARGANPASLLGGLCVPVSLDRDRFSVKLWRRY